jgi:hypothetical protein
MPPTVQPNTSTTTDTSTKDPGKVLYIISMVCAFTFLQVPGLILAIISWNKSKNAGFPTTVATTAIVVNSVLLVLGMYFLFLISNFRLS